MSPRLPTLALLASLLVSAAAAEAQRPPAVDNAPRVYIVRPGDSIQRIARYLQVPLRELAARNSLNPPYTLREGRRLRLPEGVPPEVLRELPLRDAPADDTGAGPHRSGVVSLVRLRDGGEMVANFTANPRNLRARLERIMRSRGGIVHTLHPRLIRLFPQISDHFNGRRILVLSGYRPHTGGRDAPRSRHAMGTAVDVRVENVPLRTLFAFCQTLPDTGCGMAAGANYLHLDVRTAAQHWTVTGRRGSRGDPNIPPEEDVAEVLAEAAADETAPAEH